MWNLKTPELTETENRLVVARGEWWELGLGVDVGGEKVVKRCKFPVISKCLGCNMPYNNINYDKYMSNVINTAELYMNH